MHVTWCLFFLQLLIALLIYCPILSGPKNIVQSKEGLLPGAIPCREQVSAEYIRSLMKEGSDPGHGWENPTALLTSLTD